MQQQPSEPKVLLQRSAHWFFMLPQHIRPSRLQSALQQMCECLMPAPPQWDDTACIRQCTEIWSDGLKRPHRADIEGVGVRLAGQIAGPVRAEAIVQIGDGLTQLPGMWPPGPVPAGSACTSKHSCTD